MRSHTRHTQGAWLGIELKCLGKTLLVFPHSLLNNLYDSDTRRWHTKMQFSDTYYCVFPAVFCFDVLTYKIVVQPLLVPKQRRQRSASAENPARCLRLKWILGCSISSFDFISIFCFLCNDLASHPNFSFMSMLYWEMPPEKHPTILLFSSQNLPVFLLWATSWGSMCPPGCFVMQHITWLVMHLDPL
jgi:hypothetical protein